MATDELFEAELDEALETTASVLSDLDADDEELESGPAEVTSRRASALSDFGDEESDDDDELLELLLLDKSKMARKSSKSSIMFLDSSSDDAWLELLELDELLEATDDESEPDDVDKDFALLSALAEV